MLNLAPPAIVDQFSVNGDEYSIRIKELHQTVHMNIEKHNKQYNNHANKHSKRAFVKVILCVFS